MPTSTASMAARDARRSRAYPERRREVEPLLEDRLRRRHDRALGQRDRRTSCPRTGSATSCENCAVGTRAASRCRTAASSRTRPLKHATCVMSAGACTDRGRLLDRHRPVVADRVPVQLVVVVEGVQRAAHPVHDVVGVLAGDRAVGIADLDALVVAVLLDACTASGVSAEPLTDTTSSG